MANRRVAPSGEPRTVTAGRGDEPYGDNKIRTTKYTAYNFVPRNLFEQLHKFGNVYFLILSVLMYAGEHTTLFIGTIASFSTFGTLMMMMSITAMVALLDDYRRGQADKETNAQKAMFLNKTVEQKKWEDVRVGDVVFIENGQELPADIVPLFCSGEEGSCYVSTANLDGETNLKLKGAPALTSKEFGEEEAVKTEQQKGRVWNKVVGKLQTLMDARKVVVKAEAPSANIHDFQGSVSCAGPDGPIEALEAKHLLLRGTVLRNTSFCVGVVVYTGKDTRMVMNSRPAPLKLSNLERITNDTMIYVLLAQGALAFFSDITYLVTREKYATAWYLSPPQLSLPDFLSYFLTFFVLYSNMMPISLYPTMEFCNYWQTYFIKNDTNMIYKDTEANTNMPAGVRSSNLCQELGQVGYIFSDKTGTLTQNVMELKRVFIAGRYYGEMGAHKGFNGGSEMEQVRRVDPKAGKEVDDFLEVLAVAHTVMVSEGKDGKKKYEAESPDESALVETSAAVGWTFMDRVRDQMMVDVKGRGRLTYTVHGVNAFDSARKRQSVIVGLGEGQYLLLVKGADNVMLERAKVKNHALETALTTFAEQGLRTLVIGRKEITQQEFNTWKEKYDKAAVAMDRRAEQLAAVAEDIEKELEIVGATAIEDKLQVGVPETIVKVREAGIILWVLTGDKLETARNIGFSAKVLDNRMEIAVVDTPSDGRGANKTFFEKEIDEQKKKLRNKTVAAERALMVTGPALGHILNDDALKKVFFELAEECSILIACRVSPMQKAECVRLVRELKKPQPVTLAIGDGANDVPMIQEAQVGVGIAGREGRQAVNNADFAIGQFAYLERLLLLHGRWNYRRASKFTLFTFWRNAFQVLCIFYYTVPSGFSGTCLFEDWLRLSFNFLCSFPIMATGIFDQDVPEKAALENARLYDVGREQKDLNPTNMLKALGSALMHSAVVLFFAAMSVQSFSVLDAGDYYTFGTTVFTLLLVDINCRVAFINHTHNRYTVGSILMSFFLYVVFLVTYTGQRWLTDLLAPGMFQVPTKMMATWTFWLCCVAVPVVTTALDATILLAYRKLCTKMSQRLAELARFRDKGGREEPFSEGKLQELARTYPEVTVTAFSQQRQEAIYYFRSDNREMRLLSAGLGLLLILAGFLAVNEGQGLKQIVVAYDVEPSKPTPWVPSGTLKEEVVYGKASNITVKVNSPMKAPIMVYYAVGPFYQSYNDYMTSQVEAEFMGKRVSDAQRKHFCVADSVRERNGKAIVPCGAPATTMFDDTFTFYGVNVSTTEHVGWSSDISRFKNPPHDPNTTWATDLYPMLDHGKGVQDPRFVEWVRPGATPDLIKRYGWINQDLGRDDEFKVNVTSTFNVTGLNGYKYLVLTEVGYFGARDNRFGKALIVGGGLTLLLNFIQFFLLRQADEELFVSDETAPFIQNLNSPSSLSNLS